MNHFIGVKRMSSKVLITGIAGLLGSNFSRYLLTQGYEVIGIDDFSGGYKENLAKGVHCENINLAKIMTRKIRNTENRKTRLCLSFCGICGRRFVAFYSAI